MADEQLSESVVRALATAKDITEWERQRLRIPVQVKYAMTRQLMKEMSRGDIVCLYVAYTSNCPVINHKLSDMGLVSETGALTSLGKQITKEMLIIEQGTK
jgi:hypothetical protein